MSLFLSHLLVFLVVVISILAILMNYFDLVITSVLVLGGSASRKRPRVEDPCTSFSSGSICEDGFCTGVYWVEEEFRTFTTVLPARDSILRPVVREISCASAGEGEGIVSSFNMTRAEEVAYGMFEIVKGPFMHAAKTFPMLEEHTAAFEEAERSMASYSRDHRSPVELFLARKAVARTEVFRELFALIDSHTESVTNMAPSMSGTKMTSLARCAHWVLYILPDFEDDDPEVENSFGLLPELKRLRASPWLDLEPIAVPDDMDGERSVAILKTIEDISALAQSVAAAIRSRSTPLVTNKEEALSKVTEFTDILRMFVSNEAELRTTRVTHLAMLMYLFEDRICQRVDEIPYLFDYDTSAPDFVMPALLRLCRSSLPVAKRLAAAAWAEWASRGEDPGFLRIGIPGHPRESMLEVSMYFLTRSSPKLLLPLAIVFEGNQMMGMDGPRRQWIHETASHVFRPVGVFQYTDSSETAITVIPLDSRIKAENQDKVDLLRAAGRMIGLALRYEVPLSVHFARSFIKMLRMIADPPRIEDLDSLLREEDPEFLQGLGRFTRDLILEYPEMVEYDGLGGRHGFVTEDQLDWFLRESKIRKLFTQYSIAMSVVREGVADVVGPMGLHLVSEEELVAHLCAPDTRLTAQDLLDGIIFRHFTPEHDALMENFRSVILDLSQEDVEKFVVFATGMARRPVSPGPWIKVFPTPLLGDNHLPRSHTCHYEFQLPLYTSAETMREKILLAIRMGLSIEGHTHYTAHADAAR